MSNFNVRLRVCIVKLNICLITKLNAEDVSSQWPGGRLEKKKKSNQTGSLLVLLTYPFKHFNWQTPSNPLTAPGGVSVEHQTDGGKI